MVQLDSVRECGIDNGWESYSRQTQSPEPELYKAIFVGDKAASKLTGKAAFAAERSLLDNRVERVFGHMSHRARIAGDRSSANITVDFDFNGNSSVSVVGRTEDKKGNYIEGEYKYNSDGTSSGSASAGNAPDTRDNSGDPS